MDHSVLFFINQIQILVQILNITTKFTYVNTNFYHYQIKLNYDVLITNFQIVWM